MVELKTEWERERENLNQMLLFIIEWKGYVSIFFDLKTFAGEIC